MRTGVEDKVVAIVESLRGKVARGPTGEVLQVNLHSSKDASGDRLEFLRALRSLQVLNLYDTPVTDSDLAHLAGLVELISLDISQTLVTDAGLRHLRRLSRLSVLKVANTAVTDTGLTHLRELPSLRWLVLTGNQVSEQAVKELERTRLGLTVKR